MARRLILFHWTYRRVIPDILSEGFIISTKSGLTHGPGVYLSDGVLSFAKPGRNALFEVEVYPTTQPGMIVFEPDMPAFLDTSELWYCVKDTRNISAIRLIPEIRGVVR